MPSVRSRRHVLRIGLASTSALFSGCLSDVTGPTPTKTPFRPELSGCGNSVALNFENQMPEAVVVSCSVRVDGEETAFVRQELGEHGTERDGYVQWGVACVGETFTLDVRTDTGQETTERVTRASGDLRIVLQDDAISVLSANVEG
jgi:hypothetical protein